MNGYDTITSSFNSGAVMIRFCRWTLSIRMYVASLAVTVTVFAMGAVMCIKAAGVVIVTAGDMGAIAVKFDPIGPVPMKLQAAGEM